MSVHHTSEDPFIGAEAINRAKRVKLDGDLTPELDPESVPVDPAGAEMPEYTFEEKTEACRGLATGVVSGLAATAEMLGAGIDLDEAERVQLGHVWGDVLRHWINIREGQKWGDLAKASGETGAILSRKISGVNEGHKYRAESERSGNAKAAPRQKNGNSDDRSAAGGVYSD